MRKQNKEELELWYSKKDPWGYITEKDDLARKIIILEYIERIQPKNILDIGCGEGWITKDIQADHITGIDISAKAISRCNFVGDKIVFDIYKDNLSALGEFDFVLVTGVLYGASELELKKLIKLIEPEGYLLSCHLTNWEFDASYFDNNLKIIKEKTFSYRNRIERIVLYKKELT